MACCSHSVWEALNTDKPFLATLRALAKWISCLCPPQGCCPFISTCPPPACPSRPSLNATSFMQAFPFRLFPPLSEVWSLLVSFHWHRTFYSHGDLRACLSSLFRWSMHSLRSKYSSESPSHPHQAAHSTCAITAYGNLPGTPPLTAGRHQVSTNPNLLGSRYWGVASCPSC